MRVLLFFVGCVVLCLFLDAGSSEGQQKKKPKPRPKPIPRKVQAPKPAPPKVELPQEKGFVPLFNGKDLTGWILESGPKEAWAIVDGAIVCQGKGSNARGWLLSEKSYTDFLFRCKFQLSNDADSGIGIRAEPGERIANLPIHLNVKLRRHPIGQVQTGSLYYWLNTAEPPVRQADLKPPVAWNDLEIELGGPKLRVLVNGREVQNLDLTRFASLRNVLGGAKRSSGRIGLAQHSGEARFRDIRIKDLTGGVAPPAPTDLLVAGSVWRSTAGPQVEVIVTGRTGQKFTAEMRWNGRHGRNIEGSVVNDVIKWYAAPGERNKGHYNVGTIKGQRIEFKYYTTEKLIATGKASGAGTLAWVTAKASPPVVVQPVVVQPVVAPERPAEIVDVTNANAVWRQLAALTSFSWGGERKSSSNEKLYLPYRSNHLIGPPPGLFGPQFDMLLRSNSGAPVKQDPTLKLLAEYEALADAQDPDLKRATQQALAICRTRLRLALANEAIGNTPASSIRSFQQKVFAPAVQYTFLREADRANWQESLERQHPGYRFIVTDAPMSAESRQKLDQFFQGAAGIKEDIQNRAVASGLLAYADMAQVDRTVAFWQNALMPLVKRCSGPASKKPLVEISASWKVLAGRDRFQRLNVFHVRNVAGRELTHVVVALRAQNQWGERADHYYYLPQLDVAEMDWLMPNERWNKRRLPFTNSLTVTCSVWADQGSYTSQTQLTSPAPNPDPEPARKRFLDYDKTYQAKGEALGVVVQKIFSVPVDPAGTTRRLKAAAAPGTSYLFKVPGEGKSVRTLVLRFVRLAEGVGAVEATVIDLKSGKPFQENIPVWKGQLHNFVDGKGIIFGTRANWQKSGWAFGIDADDTAIIFCPAAGAPGAAFPSKHISPFAVKTP